MATLHVAAKIDGTDYGDLGSGTVPNDFLNLVSFGAYAAGASHFDIRNILVGTSGYGSSDLFAPVLDDLTEFNGVFGDNGNIVASGGVLSVDSTDGNDHYAYAELGSDITTAVYVEFQLRTRTGDGDPDYQDVWDSLAEASTDGSNVQGIFNETSFWSWDGTFGDNFGDGAIPDTWQTLDLFYGFFPFPTGPDFVLSLSPASLTVPPGIHTLVVLHTTAIDGDTETITLSETHDPEIDSVVFDTNPLTAGDDTQVFIDVDPSATDGTYTVSITATGTDNTHSIDLPVTVSTGEIPGFHISS